MKKKNNVFMEGAVAPGFIAESIQSHATRTDIGAHSIFLGQVRADEIDGKAVTAIDYSCYQEMADEVLGRIREEILAKYPLRCLHIHHSLGRVKAGEISLFVFVSSRHRKDCTAACAETVEKIKAEVPVFAKEVFEDETYVWKKNN